MKNILKKIIYAYLIVLIILSFIPFTNLYFLLNNQLQKNNIFINEKKVSSFLSTVKLNNVQLYYEDIKALKLDVFKVNIYLLYNSINISDITIDEGLKDFLPEKINEVTIYYSILYPTKAFISSDGDFGEVSGHIDFINRKVFITLIASNKFRKSFKKQLSLMQKLTNQVNGYIYEYKY
jgi:hypothetical protein